jgi:ABC-type sugar transport system permease subunit
MNLATKPS